MGGGATAAWRELAARYSGLVLGWVEAFQFPGQPGASRRS